MSDRLDLYGAITRLEARAEVPAGAASALWDRLEETFPDVRDLPATWELPAIDVVPPEPVARRLGVSSPHRWSIRGAVALAAGAAVVAAALAIPRLIDRDDRRGSTLLNEPSPSTTVPTPTSSVEPATTEPPPPSANLWQPMDVGPLLDRATLLPAVWTGNEVVMFGTAARPRSGTVVHQDQGAAYNPATGQWRLLPPEPLDRPSFDVVVWTGTEVLLWGGSTPTNGVIPTFESDGVAYNPATNTWRTMARAPSAAMRPAAVWTGREMIVFGGEAVVGGPPAANPGFAYDPAADSWRTIAGAPIDKCGCYRTVWAGTEMIAVSQNVAKDLPIVGYDPASDTWRTLAPSPLAARSDPALVWTGRELIEWGGTNLDDQPLDDGAAYDPVTNSWRRLADAPIPGRMLAAVAWTGRDVLIVGGYTNGDLRKSGWLNDGALYNPKSDQWVTISAGSLPTLSKLRGAYQYKWAWTGSQLVLAGGIGIYDADKRAAATYRP